MNVKMIFLFVIGVLLVCVLTISFSFALWVSDNQQSGDGIVNSGCLSINYSEDSESLINLSNAYPISDIDGMRSTPYVFTVTNTCSNNTSYLVNLEVLNTTTLSHSLIKGALDYDDPVIVSSNEEVDAINSSAKAYSFDDYILEPNESVTHEFRMWIDSSATMSNSANKVVDAKISVVANSTFLPYDDEILAGADPILDSKMLPVIINDDGSVIVADVEKKWYSYENSEWANAVIVDPTYTNLYIGVEIPLDKIEQMYVWIPRYSYVEESVFDADTAVDLTFVDISASAHPAFTFGEEELPGFWIGKFEQGVGNKIVPNINSFSNASISVLYDNVNNTMDTYGLDEESDVHIIKNMEWGAVAYLSQSKYGICSADGTCGGKVENNSYFNSTSYASVTGCGGVDTSTGVALSGIEICPLENRWSTANGVKASTTANVTGVYDMAGGKWEYVMANMVNEFGNFNTWSSGFSVAPASKYYDSYTYGTYELDYHRAISGDGIKELDATSVNMSNWNTDYAYFIYKMAPWFVRGGRAGNDIYAGIWAFYVGDGAAALYTSTRSVMSIIL